jgi:hypothetical protein
MIKELVTYNQSQSLRELGFIDEYNLWEYNTRGELTNKWGIGNISASLKQQVFRWFREKYGAHIHPTRIMPNVYMVQYGLWTSKSFDTYEEAESACIDKLIELAKQQSNIDDTLSKQQSNETGGIPN